METVQFNSTSVSDQFTIKQSPSKNAATFVFLPILPTERRRYGQKLYLLYSTTAAKRSPSGGAGLSFFSSASKSLARDFAATSKTCNTPVAAETFKYYVSISSAAIQKAAERSTRIEGLTPAAESLAQKLQIADSVTLTRRIIQETFGSRLKSLKIDVQDDPEDDDHSTICFRIELDGNVDDALLLDARLQTRFIQQIPPEHRIHLSISYDL